MRVCTQYDKLYTSLLSFIYFISITILLRLLDCYGVFLYALVSI